MQVLRKQRAKDAASPRKDAMPTRTLLIIGSILIVVLIAIIPVAFLMGGRHATSHQPVEHASPTSSAPLSPGSATGPLVSMPPQAPPASEEPAKAPSDPDAGASANASRNHAKGGLLGGLVASVGDDVAAEGKHIADDLDAQGHAVVAKTRSDANAALTKTVDRAASSVDSAANELEQKAQQSVNAGVKSATHDAHDAVQSATDDPSFRAFVENLTKQETADAAALATLSSTVHNDLAAAAKDVSTKVHAYGDSIKKLASPANLLHAVSVPDEAAIAHDVDKQAAQVRAALEAFGAATDAIQRRCDDAVAHLHQTMADERAKLTAQISQAEAAYDKQIASLHSDLSAEIAQAVAAATHPLDDAQAKPKATRSGK